MKFLFSLCFFSNLVFGQMIRIHSFHEKNAIWAKEILMAQYQIPEDVIEINMIKECAEIQKDKKKWEICLAESGEMIFLATPKNVIQTLKTFKL